jgi:hypothetical protein
MKIAALLAFVCVGCTSVGASAVRTGPLRLPPRAGPVSVFVARQPTGGTQIGVVEVHAAQNEATIDALVPLFVKKVAEVGGNGAVIDGVYARFDLVARPVAETYMYPCGFRSTCVGTRYYMINDEVMTVTVRGRAFHIPAEHPEAPK